MVQDAARPLIIRSQYSLVSCFDICSHKTSKTNLQHTFILPLLYTNNNHY